MSNGQAPWDSSPRYSFDPTNGRGVNHARVQRPVSQRPVLPAGTITEGPRSRPPSMALRLAYDWKGRTEVTVRIRDLHPDSTTWDLQRNFQKEGNIVLIEIFEERDNVRRGNAKIRFSPPPSTAFWLSNRGIYPIFDRNEANAYNVVVSYDEKANKRPNQIQSPIRKYVYYDDKMKLYPKRLDFGPILQPDSLMPMRTIERQPPKSMSFVVDLFRKKIVAEFNVTFIDPRIERLEGAAEYVSEAEIGASDRINKHMFEIPFGQLKTISRVELNNGDFALIITLDSPPQFFRQMDDLRKSHSEYNLVWTDFDSWFRQTDIVYEPSRRDNIPIMLQKERPVIDIGRWTTYRWVFRTAGNDLNIYNSIKSALQDFNIEIVPLAKLNYIRPHLAQLWSLIDHPDIEMAAADIKSLQNKSTTYLPFEVRYQLEVCISHELISEHNISEDFVKILAELASQDPTKARNILEYVAEQDKRIYDPMTIFSDKDALAHSSRTEIPHYCAYSRKAKITPSSIVFSSPTVETTNRVLRHYSRENKEGRFLRVQFTDEKFEGRINACADKKRNDELFTRVYRTLYNGIRIGDRHYQFLAFGNSQFRENGAYFFCPTEHLSCDDIRQWMGNFSHINVVAKYAARLGQCFSTTRAINGLSKPEIVKIPDIERNGYNFTDGVGKISPFLAQIIASDLRIPGNNHPSAFQFRLGGCKGILVVSPDAKGSEVHIRKSQQKFTAIYNGLEIIRCSRFSSASLNRQTIQILSILGVADEVFVQMLVKQLSEYQSAMTNHSLALSLLSRHIDDNHMTLNIANMIQNGFMTANEPFFLSLLHLWRAWSIKLLKEKAKIIIEQGAFVLGCVDETDTLRGYKTPTVAPGSVFREEELPEIFIQIPDRDDPSRYIVIEGTCLVGRNPSLHPGDLRVVKAVNVPALHHLRDVVVFPRTGERDVPSMCSGGDLDGDDYFVIWDKALQPTEWNSEPMDYSPPNPKTLGRPVQVVDLMKFFVRFMKNDALPTIAHAHMAQSDWLMDGVKDSKCLELAKLHSKAVDYVKTGQPAELPKRLRPSKWPHYMEKIYKPKDQIYHSEKILGQLYDKVDSVDFMPQYEASFDKRILKAYQLNSAILMTARQVKSQYDVAMRRIMAQQEIKTEFEVWSTFVLSKSRYGSDYKMQEEMGTISGALKDQFRHVCIEKAGSKEFSVLGPFIAAMYRVTKEEMDIALAECQTTKFIGGKKVPKRKMDPRFMPLISFPWLFEKELGRIATGIEVDEDLADMPIVSLTSRFDSLAPRKRLVGTTVDEDDYVKQEDGVIVHRGEVLDLFSPDDSDELSGESDYEEARGRREPGFKIGESGEVVIDQAFPELNSAEPNGTGVEEIVPRHALDGFIKPDHESYKHLANRNFDEDNWQSDGPTSSSNSQNEKGTITSSSLTGFQPHTPVSSINIVSSGDLAPTKDIGGTPESDSPIEEVLEEEEVIVLLDEETPADKLALMHQ